MARITIPKHKCPVRHVGISASQNVYKSSAGAERREAESFAYYLENGLMPSLKFRRCVDDILEGYDENKAMFPVYGNVPLFAVTAISAAESGMDVSVVGSRDVGIIVDELKYYYCSIGREDVPARLKWVPECSNLDNSSYDDRQAIAEERKRIRLNSSMAGLAGSMGLAPEDAFLFVTGDIIFYDYPCAAGDPDIASHSIVVDFNGKETINPPIPRNYYHCLRREDGRNVHFKEPNVWAIGSEFNLGLSDDTYSHAQKGGFGPKAFLKMAGRNIAANPWQFMGKDMGIVIRMLMMEAASMLTKKFAVKTFIPRYRQKDLESIAKYVTMAPVRIKAEHTDYLRLKDVDALHDYVFIRRLVERHCSDVFPEHIAKSIMGFAAHLEKSGAVQKISTFVQLPERINGKVRRVQAMLNKRGCGHKIELPFSSNGEFQAEPMEGESLEKAVERSKRDLEKYYGQNPTPK